MSKSGFWVIIGQLSRLFLFPLVLLRCNWQTTCYKFKIRNRWICWCDTLTSCKIFTSILLTTTSILLQRYFWGFIFRDSLLWTLFLSDRGKEGRRWEKQRDLTVSKHPSAWWDLGSNLGCTHSQTVYCPSQVFCQFTIFLWHKYLSPIHSNF